MPTGDELDVGLLGLLGTSLVGLTELAVGGGLLGPLLPLAPIAAYGVIDWQTQQHAKQWDQMMHVTQALPVSGKWIMEYRHNQAQAYKHAVEAWAIANGTTVAALKEKYRKPRKPRAPRAFKWPGLHHSTTSQLQTIYLKNNAINDRFRKLRR